MKITVYDNIGTYFVAPKREEIDDGSAPRGFQSFITITRAIQSDSMLPLFALMTSFLHSNEGIFLFIHCQGLVMAFIK